MAEQPQQHLFVSRRSMALRTDQGAIFTFEKGKPTHLPKAFHAMAMEKGIMPCDAKGVELDLEAVQKAAPAQEPKVLVTPETAEERREALFKTFEAMVARNNAADFTAGGTPNAQACTVALGWRVDQKEVRDAWVKFRSKE